MIKWEAFRPQDWIMNTLTVLSDFFNAWWPPWPKSWIPACSASGSGVEHLCGSDSLGFQNPLSLLSVTSDKKVVFYSHMSCFCCENEFLTWEKNLTWYIRVDRSSAHCLPCKELCWHKEYKKGKIFKLFNWAMCCWIGGIYLQSNMVAA